jgi:hypothetical protein
MKDDALLAGAAGAALKEQRGGGPAADLRFFMNSLISIIGGNKPEVGGWLGLGVRLRRLRGWRAGGLA